MIRRLYLSVGAGAAMLAAAPLAAQDATSGNDTAVSDRAETRLELAQEILDIGFPEDTQVEMFQKVADQMKAQTLQSLQGTIPDDGAMEILVAWQDRISVETDAILRSRIPSLMDAWAVAYADTFSENELRDIRDFVSTPSGGAFMTRSNDVLFHPAFAAANQEYMNETMTLVMGKVPELMDDIQAYVEAQE